MLVDAATANALQFWRAWGGCFRGALFVRRGDVAAGLRLLEEALRELRSIEFGVYYVAFLCEFADALKLAGESDRGLAAIDEALDRCERNDERWCFPELLRVKAELLMQQAHPTAAADAEHYLRLSIDWAQRQDARSWELRSAVSLARLWNRQGRTQEATSILTRARNRFTEGFGTVDAVAATALLERLR
jgi:predicted ATPase